MSSIASDIYRYRRWSKLVLPMLDNTVAAASAVGATIVLPGTIYNFDPDALPVLTEESPQHPVTRKGAIRVEMERRLLAASKNGTRVLIVRAGDFFGPKAGNNWFSQGLVKPGKPVTAISNPGRRGVGHQWSYLPDVARTVIELLASGFARTVRHVPHGWALGCRRLASDRVDPAGDRAANRSQASGRRISMVAAHAGFAFRRYVPRDARDARDALPVARTRTNGQRPVDCRSWARAPHPAG